LERRLRLNMGNLHRFSHARQVIDLNGGMELRLARIELSQLSNNRPWGKGFFRVRTERTERLLEMLTFDHL